MTIIFFPGLGSSKKLLNYVYLNGKYDKNNFITLLKKIDKVYIPEISYTNIYYYSEYKIMKQMYKPINKINYDDLALDKFITNLYEQMDKKMYAPPYTVIGHSHGIYYACEFAKQYSAKVKYIISLDGSWITNKLNKKRLLTWKNKGKIIPKINNQQTLDSIIDKIKNETDNQKYIDMIMTYIRSTHTKFAIKQNYEKINLPFITFRDFNSDIKNDEMKEYNLNVLEENDILSNYSNHIIYILLDATHMLWLYSNNSNTIIQTLKFIIN